MHTTHNFKPGDKVIDRTAEENEWPDVEGEVTRVDGPNVEVRYLSGNTRAKLAINLRSKAILYTVDGFDISNFEIIDAGDVVTLIYTIISDEIPSPNNMSFRELIDKSGAINALTAQGWIDGEGKVLSPIKYRRECNMTGVNEFKVKITLTKQKPN